MNAPKDAVLVVDDNESNIDILVEILGERYSVSVAMDGNAALEAVNRNQPDLILLDIVMPGMDGYAVCSKLKANPETRMIPVIFVTAKNEIRDEAIGFSVGCVDYITKPVNPSIVTARVKNHIELSKARKELEIRNIELMEQVRTKELVEKITNHDLKNPLTALFSGIDYLLKFGKLNPEQAETVSLMKTSAHKMLNMINSSLDLFKMEQGIYRLNPTKIDILNLINTITKELKAYSDARKITVAVKDLSGTPGAGGNYLVKGEELLCYSMLANLIKNAIEASPENEIITISLSEANDQIAIQIQNQGEVPEAIQKTFFEKFVTHGKPQGTGLGTYSAKLIAETLNGCISMESGPQNGTVVSVFLQSA